MTTSGSTEDLANQVVEVTGLPPATWPRLQKAVQWLQEADAVLICAGAGMSGNPGEMVYTNPRDFAKYYPWLLPYGYNNCYECMGILHDPHVPETLKRTYMVAHAYNQRYRFAPNPSYSALLKGLVDMGKDCFVYTSNVDGCFERTGFKADKIYTPQGDWAYMQCEKPCTRDSYWLAKPHLDKLIPLVPDLEGKLPTCPRCGGAALGSVRGGDWFTHAQYDAAQDRFVKWVLKQQQHGRKLAILEIGVGFNTPIVTRWPMEQICRETASSMLIRLNPKDCDVPADLQGTKAVGLPCGWNAAIASLLLDQSVLGLSPGGGRLRDAPPEGPRKVVDWRGVLASLRR
mmetsp:Transcript_56251/g.131770  ORF Transcript_56251/g.131770 Transcript_56251/m.131770 type:complete len:344 (-) Transcript_56251:114-1145(-)